MVFKCITGTQHNQTHTQTKSIREFKFPDNLIISTRAITQHGKKT